MADRTTQISDHTLLVHNELVELRRALQIAERENKRREQALEAHQQRTKDLLSEADKSIQLAREETFALHQQNKKREAQMQREYASLATNLSDVKSCAAAFMVRARLAISSFSHTADQLSSELHNSLAAEESARRADQERMQDAMAAAHAKIAEKDADIEELQRRNEDLASKLDGYQLRIKTADERARRLEEDKAGLTRQAAEHADTVRGLQQELHGRERELRATQEKMAEAMRAAMEAREDLAAERRGLEGERLRGKAAEVVVEELKVVEAAQATTIADLRQQLAACKVGLQRAAQEAAVCRESLEECGARLADSEAKHRRAAADLAEAVQCANRMYQSVCRVSVGVCRGVGLVLGSDVDGLATVIRVLEGSAAHCSGNIVQGDVVLEVDGSDVRGRSVGDVEQLLVGVSGNKVVLTLRGSDGRGKKSVTLKRYDAKSEAAPDGPDTLAARAAATVDAADAMYCELERLRRQAGALSGERKALTSKLEAVQSRLRTLEEDGRRALEKARADGELRAAKLEQSLDGLRRDYAALGEQLSGVKSCAADFVARTRLSLASYYDELDKVGREVRATFSGEEIARRADQERMQDAMAAAHAKIAEKDADIEELQRRNEDLASKLDGYQLRIKTADERARRLEEDKAGLTRQAAEHADTVRGLQQELHGRERELRATQEKMAEAMRAAMEAREDLAAERRGLEGERLRGKAAEVVVEELKVVEAAQATTIADLRQQLAACKVGLQRAAQEAAVCRESLEECGARLADSEAKHRRAAADLAEAAAAAAGMHRAICRTAVAVCRGVGLVLGSDADGRVAVLRVLDGSAADACGSIRQGDVVLEVDGGDVRGRSVGDVEQLLTGPAGSSVTLLLEAAARLRAGSELSARPGPPIASVTLVRDEGDDVGGADGKRYDERATEAVSVADAVYRELEELRRRTAHSGAALADTVARLDGARRMEALLRETVDRERGLRAAEARSYEERGAAREAAIAVLQDEVATLRKALAAREAELSRSLAAADKATEAHAAQREKLEGELRDTAGRLRASSKECTEKDVVIAQLRRELEALRLRYDTLERDGRAAAAAAEQQRDAAIARLRKQEEEARRLAAALDAASEMEAALRASLLAAEARAREESAALRGECAEKNAEIGVLQGSLESARAAVVGLEKALHDMEARLAASQRAEADVRAALDSCRREGAAAADRVQALEAEVARLSELCGRREDAGRELEKQLEQAAQLEAELRQRLEQAAHLEADLRERLSQAARLETELREQLVREKTAAEAALRACREDCKGKDSELAGLRAELAAALASAASLREALATAERRLEESAASVGERDSAMEALRRELAAAQQQVAQLRAQCEDNVRDLAGLRAELERVQSEAKRAAEEAAEALADAVARSKKSSESGAEIERALRECQAQCKEKGEALKEAQEELRKLRKELAERGYEIEDLRAALAAAEARATAAETALAECHCNCGEKDALIRDLQVSRGF